MGYSGGNKQHQTADARRDHLSVALRQRYRVTQFGIICTLPPNEGYMGWLKKIESAGPAFHPPSYPSLRGGKGVEKEVQDSSC